MKLNMRQHRWLKMLKNYDSELLYHPSKANAVAGASSLKEYSDGFRATLTRIDLVSSLIDRIKMSQREALLEEKLKSKVMVKQHLLLTKDSRALTLFRGLIQVPKIGGNRELLLEDTYKSKYPIYPESTKMYRGLKLTYVKRCVTYLQVKAKHQQPYDGLQFLETTEWKW